LSGIRAAEVPGLCNAEHGPNFFGLMLPEQVQTANPIMIAFHSLVHHLSGNGALR
jgi:hypothetical protein